MFILLGKGLQSWHLMDFRNITSFGVLQLCPAQTSIMHLYLKIYKFVHLCLKFIFRHCWQIILTLTSLCCQRFLFSPSSHLSTVALCVQCSSQNPPLFSPGPSVSAPPGGYHWPASFSACSAPTLFWGSPTDLRLLGDPARHRLTVCPSPALLLLKNLAPPRLLLSVCLKQLAPLSGRPEIAATPHVQPTEG